MRRQRETSDAFGTAALASRILVTLVVSIVLSVAYADLAYASDATVDPTGEVAPSDSTDSGATPATPPADETTSPPADETTSPPADETTSPPADSETTEPSPDPSASDPGTDPATDPAEESPGVPDETDPVNVPPPTPEPGPELPQPSTNDAPPHGLVAANGADPSPDSIVVQGNEPVESGLPWMDTPIRVHPPAVSQPDTSSSTRDRGNDKAVPRTPGSAAVLGALGDALASAGGAAGASASGSGAGTAAFLTALIVFLAAVFTRAVQLFALPPRELVLIADLERPD